MASSAPEQPTGGARTGRVLGGRYELGEAIGRGGSAVVYRARDVRDERAVAVKLFGPGVDGVGVRRREREMRLLSALDHPGLVAVLDAGVDDTTGDERSFLVMQLVEGDTLAKALMPGPLAPARVSGIGRDLARALAHVHSHEITHRDVKPANVLLDTAGRARLTDFGIALLVDQTRLTSTGAVIGTAAYMSPEQVCGEPVGPPTDVYALGLVLLEAMTGRSAYAGTGREMAVARLVRPPEVPPDLPAPFARLLEAMTSEKPEDRPAAAEVASVLDESRAGTMVVVIPPPRASAPAAPRHAAVAGTTPETLAPAPAPAPAPPSVPARARWRTVGAVGALLVTAGLAAAGAWSLAGTGGSAADPPRSALSPITAPPSGSAPPDVPAAGTTQAGPSSVPLARGPAAGPVARTTPGRTADRDDAPRSTDGAGRNPAAPGVANKAAAPDKSGNGEGNGSGKGSGKGKKEAKQKGGD